MVANLASLRFPESDSLNKTFQVIIFLVNNLKVDHFGIRFKGLLPLDTLCVGMDIIFVKKAHDLKTIKAKVLDRIYGARGTAYMK